MFLPFYRWKSCNVGEDGDESLDDPIEFLMAMMVLFLPFI